MDTEQLGMAEHQPTPRTGPVGRLARLLLAALLASIPYDLWVDRDGIFSEADPGLLILTAFAVYGLYQIASLAGLRWQAMTATAVMIAGAGTWVLAFGDRLWAPPLSPVIWGLDFGVMLVITIALLVAAAVGTPGCEIAVFREFARRLRREPNDADVLFCLVGLHRLDGWEASKAWRRQREE